MKENNEFDDIFYSKEFGDTVHLTTNFRREDKVQHKTWIRILMFVCLFLFVMLCLVWFHIIDLQSCLGITIMKPIPISPTCNVVPDTEKIDCYPDAPVTESECIKRGCCYSVTKSLVQDGTLPPLNVPYCYYSIDYKGYVVKNLEKTPWHVKANLERIQPSGFPKDVSNLNLLVTFIDDCLLRIKVCILISTSIVLKSFKN